MAGFQPTLYGRFWVTPEELRQPPRAQSRLALEIRILIEPKLIHAKERT